MIKKVAIFGLGYQGKQFLKYFLKHSYEVVGICKTKETQRNIQEQFWISVYTDYKMILNNNIDLLILCAYPINIYSETIKYSEKFNYKILADLPITFDRKQFLEYEKNNQLFLFLQEAKLDFFRQVQGKISDAQKIEIFILQNKLNLQKQTYKKESIIVDTHYALCNVLWFEYKKINISYVFVERKIKNMEYVIKMHMLDSSQTVLLYEDGKQIVAKYKNGFCISKMKKIIVFDEIMDIIILDIEQEKNIYKKEYFQMLLYLFKKLSYE